MPTDTALEEAYMIVAQGNFVYFSRLESWAIAVESLMKENSSECALLKCQLDHKGVPEYSDLADNNCEGLQQIDLDNISDAMAHFRQYFKADLRKAFISMPYYHAVVIKGRESYHAIVDKDLVHVTQSAVAQGIVIVAESTVSEEVVLKKFFDDDGQRLLARIEQEYGPITIEFKFTSPHQGGRDD